MKKYLRATQYRNPEDPLFMDEYERPIDQHMYRRRLKWYHSKLKLNHNALSHAYRRGGAIYYYKLGVPLIDIKRLGTWRSNAIVTYLRNHHQSVSSFRKALKARKR